MSDNQIGQEVYAELRPKERHRLVIDHVFVLRGGSRLTGVGRNSVRFAVLRDRLVRRCPLDHTKDNAERAAWKAVHLPPHFGRQPRRQSFQGWIVGMPCQPLDPETADSSLFGLAELFTKEFKHDESLFMDRVIDSEHKLTVRDAARRVERSSPHREVDPVY